MRLDTPALKGDRQADRLIPSSLGTCSLNANIKWICFHVCLLHILTLAPSHTPGHHQHSPWPPFSFICSTMPVLDPYSIVKVGPSLLVSRREAPHEPAVPPHGAIASCFCGWKRFLILVTERPPPGYDQSNTIEVPWIAEFLESRGLSCELEFDSEYDYDYLPDHVPEFEGRRGSQTAQHNRLPRENHNGSTPNHTPDC